MREASLYIAAFPDQTAQEEFRWQADRDGVRYEFAEGCWEGQKERTVIVNAADWPLVERHFTNEDAVLFLGPQHAPVDGGPRKARLFWQDGRTDEVGWFLPVGEGREYNFKPEKAYTKTSRLEPGTDRRIVTFYQVIPLGAFG